MDSLVNNDKIKIEDLNKRAEELDKTNDAANINNKYEEVLRMKIKSIITVAYHQGKVLSWFPEKEKFVRFVANFKIHKGTIIFKINVSELIQKYSRLKKSCVTPKTLKEYADKTRASLNRYHLFEKTFLKLNLQFIIRQTLQQTFQHF